MPRNVIPSEDPPDKAARERLEAALKRALWAQRASRSWAAHTAAEALQPNR